MSQRRDFVTHREPDALFAASDMIDEQKKSWNPRNSMIESV